MCRLLVYLGPELTLESLITRPRNSLIHQSYAAEEYLERLNGDGFGVAWYAQHVVPEPAVFRSITPAWSNRNLLNLSRVVRSSCVMAHIRAASATFPVSEPNCHPFVFGSTAFCHNGDVGGFGRIRRPLRASLGDLAYNAIEGSTDSEHIFALVVDEMDRHKAESGAERLAHALERAIARVRALQASAGIDDKSWLNLALTDGRCAAITRYTDAVPDEAMSLYVHSGQRYVCQGDVCTMIDPGPGEGAVIVSSERLSDEPGWRGVPVNHVVVVEADRTASVRALAM